MRVVCDQCTASYKVPNARLTKPVNKATCKSCGSRLLIPKPPPGADDDERVIVPAVPPTSGVGDRGIVNPGMEDDDDKTVPVVDRAGRRNASVDDIPLLTGSPIGSAEREAFQRARQRPEPAGPEVKVSSPPVITRQTRSAEAPRPAPAADGGVHTLAAVGVVVAFLGGILVASSSSVYMTGAGAVIASCGLLTALLAEVLSGFGASEPRNGVALGVAMPLGVVIGGMIAAILHLTSPATATAADATAPAGAAASTAPAKVDATGPTGSTGSTGEPAKTPEPAPAPAAAPPPPPPPPLPANATAEEKAARDKLLREQRELAERERELREREAAAARAAAQAAARSTPAPAAASTPAATPTPAPAPAAAPAPAPAPAPKPASTLPETVSRDVINTIIQSNVSVKRCLFDALRTQEIVKPVTVKLSFYLSASGRASSVRVTAPSNATSGAMARCLDGAFQTMTFPPAQQGTQVNYPINL